MPTKSRPTQPLVAELQLPVVQRKAMEWLCAGKTPTESADLSGVSRRTVYRWIKEDPQFRRAYDEWHMAMVETGRSKLSALTEIAVETIGNAIQNSDVKSAFRLLDNMGSLQSRQQVADSDTFESSFDDKESPVEYEREKQGNSVWERKRTVRMVDPPGVEANEKLPA